MNTSSSRLLRIDASARIEGSHSRRLGDLVEAQWRLAHPQGERVHRDLAHAAPPHIAGATIQGFYAPPEQLTPPLREATALSDTLVAELRSADTVLIASPMYNYGPPSALKAWVDRWCGRGTPSSTTRTGCVACCRRGSRCWRWCPASRARWAARSTSSHRISTRC